MKKIIFVANSSRRLKYYKLIAAKLGEQASVIFPIFPTLALFWGAFFKAPVDEDELLGSHLRRQKINYPGLNKSALLWKIYCFLAYVVERARFYHYYHIFRKLDCEAVALWNGQKQPYLTMVKAAEHAKKRILFLENGLMPNTTTADYAGVNAYNCLPREPQFYLDLSTDGKQVHLPTQLVNRPLHKKRDISDQQEIELPQNYIFVPFQVPGDSQIVIHSPWMHTMEQMFHALRDIHNKLREQGRKEVPHLVFKEHPSWPGNFDHLYQLDPTCIFANKNNTQQLIENAQAVVTINSTVGLESLLLGKKVVTLGHACYNIEKLVLHADNEQQLFEHMSQLANWQLNDTLRHNFLAFIASIYCIPHGWEKMLEQADDEHIDAMVARVLQTDTLSSYVKP